MRISDWSSDVCSSDLQLADSITFLHKGRLVASADKHVFVDSWRRVVCQGALPAGLDAWPEIASARANGSVVEIKARARNGQLPPRLAAQGPQVQRADRMAVEGSVRTGVRPGGVAWPERLTGSPGGAPRGGGCSRKMRKGEG